MSVEVAKQRILQRVPLATLIGETVALTMRSGRQVGLCPFHGEKSPSFTIFDDHYFCFGCRARGDAITFVREIQGLSYLESLRFLADKFGIEVPELESPTHDKQQRLTEANLYKICAESLKFFSGTSVCVTRRFCLGISAWARFFQRIYRSASIRTESCGTAVSGESSFAQGLCH